jgi:rubrerythrin
MTDETERPQQRSALEQLDRDPASRKRFLTAIGSTGAVAAFGALLAACGGSDKSSSSSGSTSTGSTGAMPASAGKNETAMFGKGDLGIVGYALTLEYLEADFYRQAAASGKLKGKTLAVAKQFGEEEAQHVQALEGALKKAGGKLPKKPKGKFPLKDEKAILKLAATVENLGAAAYLGQAARIKDKEILAAALAIHAVEGRHAAVLSSVTGEDISPDGAFAVPADAQTVLAKVKPFIAS